MNLLVEEVAMSDTKYEYLMQDNEDDLTLDLKEARILELIRNYDQYVDNGVEYLDLIAEAFQSAVKS